MHKHLHLFIDELATTIKQTFNVKIDWKWHLMSKPAIAVILGQNDNDT